MVKHVIKEKIKINWETLAGAISLTTVLVWLSFLLAQPSTVEGFRRHSPPVFVILTALVFLAFDACDAKFFTTQKVTVHED